MKLIRNEILVSIFQGEEERVSFESELYII